MDTSFISMHALVRMVVGLRKRTHGNFWSSSFAAISKTRFNFQSHVKTLRQACCYRGAKCWFIRGCVWCSSITLTFGMLPMSLQLRCMDPLC